MTRVVIEVTWELLNSPSHTCCIIVVENENNLLENNQQKVVHIEDSNNFMLGTIR